MDTLKLVAFLLAVDLREAIQEDGNHHGCEAAYWWGM
jgi:hypothetical protein